MTPDETETIRRIAHALRHDDPRKIAEVVARVGSEFSQKLLSRAIGIYNRGGIVRGGSPQRYTVGELFFLITSPASIAARARLRHKNDRACDGKMAYPTRAKANSGRGRLKRAAHRQGVHAYHCPRCHQWHLGHSAGRSTG
jgi:hypothetical protein